MELPTTSARPGRFRQVIHVFTRAIPPEWGLASAASGKGAYIEELKQNLRIDRLIGLGLIALELTFVVAAIKVFNVESPGFEAVAVLAASGFLIHHFLPEQWKIPFFAFLSAASIPLVIGWEAGIWLLSIGGALIAVCHAPIAFWQRVALIIALGIGLALARKQWLPQFSLVPNIVWPILGSMFMFRLIIYLYDLKNGAGPFSVSRAFSYFFMMPNVCFPLFPVVDYKTLQRSIYNDDALRLYHTGVKWMLRGLIQLALYKVIYLYAVIEPGSAITGMDTLRYAIATFLLYLKISGLFHLIVGLLHLYGFGLAETHHLYLFSSSFTDFWRRINIYWKDFIQKLIFNPTYFWMRKHSETSAIVVATLIAFSATWFLHSYQWYWIRGEFPIVWADLVFWFGLGIVVLINVLLEMRKGRQRTLSKQTRSIRSDAALALKIACTFTAICVLWTIWSTPELDELATLWRALLNSGPLEWMVIIAIPLLIGVCGALLRNKKREIFGGKSQPLSLDKSLLSEIATVVVIAGSFIAVSLQPKILEPLSPDLASLMGELREPTQFNEADSKKLVRGYYEDLGDAARFNGELWEVLGNRPPNWKGSFPVRQSADAIQTEFVPSTKIIATGTTRTINSLGLRDREYPIEPGPGTFRIGLVGASHDMGQGVEDDETYENVLEDRLNRELGPVTGLKFEVLNFSYPGYVPTQKLAVIEKRMIPLRPNLILYSASTTELEWIFKSTPHLMRNHLLADFSFIQNALERSGIKADSIENNEAVLKSLPSKLAPFAEDAFKGAMEKFRQQAMAHGILPALVVIELPNDKRWVSRLHGNVANRLAELGQSARLPVLNLQGAFASVANYKSLWVAPWDDHTNAEGHRLLAERLYSLLVEEQLVPTKALDSSNSLRVP